MVSERDFDDLGSFDDPEPETWKPETPGDEIKGIVIGFRAFTGKYGKVKVLRLDTPAGPFDVILSAAKLRRELAEDRKLELGDRVAIRYLGETTPAGSGNRFKDFKVLCSREPVTGSGWDDAPDASRRSGTGDPWADDEGPAEANPFHDGSYSDEPLF